MRLPKRGERGFTLIELLIVVAILGVLAAVVIPNVQRFIGAGEEEAAATELSNIQTAVTAMMVDNQLSTLPHPVLIGSQTNNMAAFPDAASDDSGDVDGDEIMDKEFDPDGVAYNYTATPSDAVGYLLYGHDIVASPSGEVDDGIRVNYVATQFTSEYYIVDANGTVSWAVPLP